MPQEIIVTSVPKGLDGGSGFQTVKRTRGMPLAVSERLHQRSGYTHRFAAGDSRNPVVLSFRTERLRVGVYYVLSLIKDAGTDHSGRQNRLAHLIALDEAEAFQKQAGPASVAKKLRDARLFLDSWNQQPHEAEAPAIISPRAAPGVCTAWRDAGFDPGLAGEIAASATSGQRAILIVPPNVDVVSLFADAMLLMPLDARWRTTFTTVGSGSDDYVWQAVRADLPEAEAARNLPGVIDLTKSPSAAEGPYVDFARSGAGMLPWQQPVTDKNGIAGHATPSAATDSSAPHLAPPPPAEPNYVPPAAEPTPPDAPPFGAERDPQQQPPVIKKRKLSEVSPRHADKPVRRQPKHKLRNYLRGAGVLVVGAMLSLAIVFTNDIASKVSALIANLKQDKVPQKIDGEVPRGESNLSISPQDEEKQKQKKNAEAIAEEERHKAEKMAAEQKQREKAEAEEKRLAAEKMAAEQRKKDAAAAANRKHLAFEQVTELPDAVSLVRGIESSSVDKPKTMPVHIGSLAVEDLIGFELALAVPKGSTLKLVPRETDGPPSWGIEATVRTIDAENVSKTLAEIYFKKGDAKDGKTDFFIEPASVDVANLREYKLLLRSALLVSATEPPESSNMVSRNAEKPTGTENNESQKTKQTRLTRQINLVKPNPGQFASLTIAPGQSKETIGLGLPECLTSDSGNNVLSVDDLTIAIEVVSPCAPDGQPKETTIAVTEKMKDDNAPAVDKRYRVPISTSNWMEYRLALDVQFQDNELGGRLLHEANHNLPLKQKAFVENTYESILLKPQREAFDQAKKRYIETKRKEFDALCTFSSFQNSATVSPGAFSKYVQARLSDVPPELIMDVLQGRNVESIDALLQKAAADVARAIAAVPTTVQLLTSRGQVAGAPEQKPSSVLQREQTVAAQEALSKEYIPFMKRLFIVCAEYFDKFLNDKRAELLPLLTTPTKIQVKKIHTDAWHDDKKYEILLVDENAEQASEQSETKTAAGLD